MKKRVKKRVKKRICNTYNIKYHNSNSSKKYFREIAIREKVWEEMEEIKRVQYIISGTILDKGREYGYRSKLKKNMV